MAIHFGGIDRLGGYRSVVAVLYRDGGLSLGSSVGSYHNCCSHRGFVLSLLARCVYLRDQRCHLSETSFNRDVRHQPDSHCRRTCKYLPLDYSVVFIYHIPLLPQRDLADMLAM